MFSFEFVLSRNRIFVFEFILSQIRTFLLNLRGLNISFGCGGVWLKPKSNVC